MNSKQMKQFIRLQFIVMLFILVILCITVIISSVVATPLTVQETNQSDASAAVIGLGIGAGLAIGLAGLGAGVGLGTASSAAIGAISERPEVFGRTIIFIAFIEGIGVFGFVIAFLLYLSI
jgi:V/A-type H+-transporting ATPase subunit K